MILDTGSIREGHSVIRQGADLASVKDDLPPFGGKIDCEATVDRTGPMLYVQLWFEGQFEQECARCCEVFKLLVSATLSLVVLEQEGRYGRAEDEETADFYFDTDHRSVDLAGVIFDEVMTSLPLKPLCSAACRGIPVAEAKEDNGNGNIDPRWEALLKLKNK